ncbi:equilibrative nucleoside transporter 2 [Arctopsyche grandis]|uniref:equilibrative nucleoside transporter 2 n=1 Tax=Arctopsyche grandis TaxID=121162 RepID=UPI00406D8C19
MAEDRVLLQDCRPDTATIVSRRSGSDMNPEKTPFLAAEPVRLTPAWESCNLPNDTLNLKGVTMETAALEVDPPTDRRNLVYLTLLLHGIGTLTPWNMFITAKAYFVDYKFSPSYTGAILPYSDHFVTYLSLCSQLPNVLFNWINIFIEIKGSLTMRIVWSISIEVLLFVGTVVLAMVDTSDCPGLFFWLTMLSVVLLNVFNGIFQNSVYGVAARLPPKYTGAVVLGSNISGALTAIASVVAGMLAPGPKTSAVYYFLTALLVLLACFDTYFALPLNRFYRYHELMAAKAKARSAHKGRPPYLKIFLQASPQLLNVFMVFFVTLSVFPNIHADIKATDPDFWIPKDVFAQVTCFLTFNLGATLGSFTASLFSWPGPRFLFLFVWARLIFLPLFMLCNYQPTNIVRALPVLINNDWVYWGIAVVHAWSSGHFSSLAMMYVSGTVDSQHAPQAGMFGAAMLITGLISGIAFSALGRSFVSWSIFK